MEFFVIALLLYALIPKVKCDNSFVSPPPEPSGDDATNFDYNPSYNPGQTIDIEWQSNYTKFDLYLYQWQGKSKGWNDGAPIAANLTTKSYKWTIDLDSLDSRIDPSQSYYNVFSLTVYELPSDTEIWFNSVAFNVTMPDDDGLSNGQIVGIAVGSTIGGIMVVGALGYLCWRCFRVSQNVVAWYDSRKAEANSHHEENGQTQQQSDNPPAFTNEPAVQQLSATSSPPPKMEMPTDPSLVSAQTQRSTPSPCVTYEVA